MPTAHEIPKVKIGHIETPSPYTEYGIRGRRGGRMGAPSAVVRGGRDALKPFKISIDGVPIPPSKIRDLVRASPAAAHNHKRNQRDGVGDWDVVEVTAVLFDKCSCAAIGNSTRLNQEETMKASLASSLGLVCFLTTATVALAADPGTEDPNNWPLYNRTANAWRYSPLDQINKDNVSKLSVSWIAHGGDITMGIQQTPIVIDGVINLSPREIGWRRSTERQGSRFGALSRSSIR